MGREETLSVDPYQPSVKWIRFLLPNVTLMLLLCGSRARWWNFQIRMVVAITGRPLLGYRYCRSAVTIHFCTSAFQAYTLYKLERLQYSSRCVWKQLRWRIFLRIKFKIYRYWNFSSLLVGRTPGSLFYFQGRICRRGLLCKNKYLSLRIFAAALNESIPLLKQDKRCMSNVTLWHFSVNVVTETQKCLNFLLLLTYVFRCQHYYKHRNHCYRKETICSIYCCATNVAANNMKDT
jgi:hypothetical protein